MDVGKLHYKDLDILDRQTFFDNRLELRRPKFHPEGGEPAILARQRQYQLFKYMEKQSPGRWAVAESSVLPLEIPDFGRSLVVRLHRAIPVPGSDVHFEKIIEFRERRRAELAALRYHIDKLYQQIQRSADPQASYVSEFHNLKRSVADVLETMKERKFQIKIGTLQAKIKWEFDTSKFSIDTTALSLGAVASAYYGLWEQGLTASVIAATAQNFFPKIEVEGAGGLVDAKSKGPLHYTLMMHEEFRYKKSQRRWPFILS